MHYLAGERLLQEGLAPVLSTVQVELETHSEPLPHFQVLPSYSSQPRGVGGTTGLSLPCLTLINPDNVP